MVDELEKLIKLLKDNKVIKYSDGKTSLEFSINAFIEDDIINTENTQLTLDKELFAHEKYQG